MNERSEFDKLLRDRLEGLTEPAPDVWEGIQRGLERHRRAVIFRRFSVGVAAAAAGLAIAWLIFRGPRDGEPVQAPVQTAQNVEITQPAQAPADPVEINSVETEIAPIAEQVAAFTRRQAVAQAEKVEKPSTREAVTETTPVVPAETPKEETPVDNPAAVQVDTPADNPAVTPAEGQGQLTETDLPADYWDIEAMADAMYSLCTNDALHEYLQVEGKKEVDGITWEKVGVRIRKLYDQCLARY